MKRILRLTAGAGAVVIGAACADVGSTPSADVTGAGAAFESVPAGFSSTSNTFDVAGDLGEAFHPKRGDGSFDAAAAPGRDREHDDRKKDRPHRDRFGFLMGGGLGPDFIGGIGFVPGLGLLGPFRVDSVGPSCVFSSSTGLVTCGPITRSGLTLLVTASITTADGTAQPKIDPTTHRVRLTSEVSGTKTRRDSATSRMAHKSDRTIAGLEKGSTRRTVDGTSAGTERTTGVIDARAFEAIRTVADTTAGIVIPLENGKPTYPYAGRISRNMSVTITLDGTTITHTRSEIVTFDGSAIATVVITQDGVTKNCTLPLPRGKLVCN